MEMPKLTKHHRKLEKMAGLWRGTETMYPSVWDPKGGKADGRNEARVVLNGFALVTDYRQKRDGVVTFEGHGVTTYDSEKKRYVLHWFDSMGSPPEVFTGNFEGDVLTLAHGGPGMHARLIYDLSRPDVLGSKMEMSQDGENWSTLFDCDYKRER